jgi:hypothetical protein
MVPVRFLLSLGGVSPEIGFCAPRFHICRPRLFLLAGLVLRLFFFCASDFRAACARSFSAFSRSSCVTEARFWLSLRSGSVLPGLGLISVSSGCQRRPSPKTRFFSVGSLDSSFRSASFLACCFWSQFSPQEWKFLRLAVVSHFDFLVRLCCEFLLLCAKFLVGGRQFCF